MLAAVPAAVLASANQPGKVLVGALGLTAADGSPVVSGVETTHPDKGTEMFLYELGVAERFRRRGVGAALVEALADLAGERECYGMWVLTDADNDAALATYARSGAHEVPPRDALMEL